MKWLLVALLVFASPIAWGNADFDDDVTVDGPLLVKQTIEAFQDIETAGAFVGPDADIDEIKQWIAYTVVFGAEQGRAYPDTVSTARDVFAFVAPVAGEIAFATLFCNAVGVGGDSLTVNVTIAGTSIFATNCRMKMTPDCDPKDSSVTCSYGRTSVIVSTQDDCSAGELVELDLDTYGTYTTDPDGVIATIYFSPDH